MQVNRPTGSSSGSRALIVGSRWVEAETSYELTAEEIAPEQPRCSLDQAAEDHREVRGRPPQGTRQNVVLQLFHTRVQILRGFDTAWKEWCPKP